MHPRRATFWRVALPAVVYLLVSLWATWPMPRVLGTHAVAHFSPEDILLDMWTLGWDVHALTTHPSSLFDGNIFHPRANTLALSEHLLGHLPIFAPVWLVTRNPVLGVNLIVFTSFWLSGLFMHVLIRRWTGNTAAAYVAGLAFAFAPWRLATFHNPHQLCSQYFPLILLTLDRTAVSGKIRTGLLAASVITLELLCSYYQGYMTLVTVGCFLVADLLIRGVRGRGHVWPALAGAVILPPLLLMPVSLPYMGAISAPMERQFRNDLMLKAAAKLTPPSMVVGYYIGQGTAVLAALLPLAWLARARGADTTTWARVLTLGFVTVAGFTISPGPGGFYDTWFAPYTWLAAIVPGFSLIRIPGRFAALASLGASAFAGFTVAYAMDIVRDPRRRLLAGSAVVIAMSAAVFWQASHFPFRLRTYPLPTGADVPPVYRWLETNGRGGPLLELEVQRDTGSVVWCAWRGEAMAMFYSTIHFLPILNGYSGYQPPSYRVLQAEAARLPDRAALQTLVDCVGLRWILVHRARPLPQPKWTAADGLREVALFPNASGGDDRLYEVQLSPQSACTLDLTG